MIPTLKATTSVHSGTRYRATDPATPLSTTELVVDRTVRDGFGMLHVVLLDLQNREISLFAEQFEAALDAGFLVEDAQPAMAYA